ncbi:MAG: MBL fold metallo-hydrolase [Verrucomicrobia bacterium]|nr:MBL fold metallo-hydrolase [Verrucomicrobiota bacterium]MBU1733936.1 MBL fold metallo-hydrolase [Verrucomicrobiota bacterium]MBU1857290.1 MBL fold metallo-hydrolase [Verrucomicrobiota bacterium]
MSLPATITILIEDSVSRPTLKAEHGLAFWIDTGSHCILFDTGQSQLILANANELKLDLDAVDTVALSHGHYDHCGGLADVLANAAGEVTVYAHPRALDPKYRRTETGTRAIGMSIHCRRALYEGRHNLKTVTIPTEITPGMFLTGEIPRSHPEEQSEPGYCLDAQCRQADPFLDDQALFIRTSGGTVVVLGCAHAGVINTLDYIRHLTDDQPFHAILGGMHLHSASDERIAWTIKSLQQFSVKRFYPMHCTGAKAVAALWTAFPGRCFPCGVGTTMNI